jgi:hypothetical protein
MPGVNWQVAQEQQKRRREANAKAQSRPQPAKAAPVPQSAAVVEASPAPTPHAPHREEIPARYITVEPKPLSAYDDNPVLNEYGAAFVVGVSADLLKKWRQRNQGPNYIQYGKDGPVRYELNDLLAFRDYFKVYLNSKRH